MSTNESTNNNGAYLVAILIPIVGMFIGVVQLGTGNKYGLSTIVVSFTAAFIYFFLMMVVLGGVMSV